MTLLRSLILILLLPLAAAAQSRSDNAPLATTSANVTWHNPVPGDPEAVALSADGRFLAASDSLRITVWGTDSSAPRATFPIHTWSHPIKNPMPIALSPDGRFLARGGSGAVVAVIDVPRGSTVAMLRDSSTPPLYPENLRRVTALAFAPDGGSLAVAHSDGAIALFDMAGGSAPRIIDSGRGGARLLRFSPDGRYLASGGAERGEIRLIDLAHPGRVRVIAMRRDTGLFRDPPALGPARDEATIAFTGDGHAIVGALASGRLMSWDVESGERESETNRGAGSMMPAMAVSPTEWRAAFAYADGTVGIMSLQELSTVRTYKVPRGVRSLLYAPDGRSLYIAGAAHAIYQLDLATGTIIREFGGGHPGGVRALAHSEDGSMLASVGKDATVILRDPGTMRILGVLDAPVSSGEHLSPEAYGQHTLAFIARDTLRHCFMENWGGRLRIWVRVWNPIERRLIESRRVDIRDDGRTIYFGRLSENGNYVAYYRPYGRVIVHRLSDGAAIDTISQRPNEPEITSGRDPEDFAFSPDESRIAVGYRNGLVGIYELATGRMIDSIQARSGATHLAFSSDGNTLHFREHIRIMSWNLLNDSTYRREASTEFIPFVASPDGRWIATGHAGAPRMLALPDLRVIHQFRLSPKPLGAEVWSASWSTASIAHDLSSMAIGTRDGAVGLMRMSESELGREAIPSDTAWQIDDPIRLDRLPFATVPDTTRHYAWSTVSSRAGDYAAISGDGDRIIVGKGRVPLLWHPGDVKPRMLGQEAVSAVFSPGGDTIAFGTFGRFVLADTAGRTLRTFNYDGGEAAGSIAYSPDGRHVAFATRTGYSDNHYVMLWDISRQTQGKRLWFSKGPLVIFGFSGDGGLLAAGTERGDTLYLYDVRRDTLRFKRTPILGPLRHAYQSSAAFSDDGERLFFASRSGRFSTFRTIDGVMERELDLGLPDRMSGMTLSPDGSMIVASSYSDTVRAWSTADGALLWTAITMGTPERIRFTADGRRIMLYRGFGNLTVLESRSGRMMHVLGNGHGVQIADLAYSHDSRMVASLTGHQIRLWDVASGELVRSLSLAGIWKMGWIHRIAFSGDDRYLVLMKLSRDREKVPFTVTVINAGTGNVVRELEGVCLEGRISISNDARRLAFVDLDTAVVTGSLPYWRDVAVLPIDREPISLDWSSRGDSLAVFNSEGIVSIFDIASGSLARRIPYAGTLSPEERGEFLRSLRSRLTSEHHHASWLLRENTPRGRWLLHNYKAGATTEDEAWSVVATEYDGALQVARRIGVTTHYFVVDDPIVREGTTAVAIAPDGSSIAAGTHGGNVILWKTVP